VKPSTADWLQYTHLEKLYGYLPGMPAALPTIFDISDEEYEAVHRTFEAAARAEAEQLRQHPEVGRLLDRLPFAEGERVLAVGDSLTDDLQC
jgi:acyl-CoA thioesterase-1